MKVCHVNEMREMDKRSINEFGITQELLMENAGEATYFALLKEFGIRNKKFVIFCGVGNNGGDGLVVARKIHSNGGHVVIILLGDYNTFKGSAKLNYNIALKLNLKMLIVEKVNSIKNELDSADFIIDAIFGTGLTREVEGFYKEVIKLINSSSKPVVSVDIPSGINGDTGQVMGIAVKSSVTVTFGLPKIGNLLYPGFEHSGKLYVTHISFPPSMHESEQIKISTNDPIELPLRRGDVHKGSCGKALFISGSPCYMGAPYLSALSFLKAGGGLSYLAAPKTIAHLIAIHGTEIILVPQEPTTSGSLSKSNLNGLIDLSENVDFVVIGPGISLDSETQLLVQQLVKEIKRPVLIDGDGITAIAKKLDVLKNRKAPTILTPHLGEFTRIVNKPINEISLNKIDILQETAKKLNSIIVMKGAHSLIGLPDQKVFINLSGNPGMATAGSGDVLTGSIAAMYGIGLSIEDAIKMGVFIHGYAGDKAAKEIGEDGIVASDIMKYIPNVLKSLRNEFDGNNPFYNQKIRVI